LALGLGGCVVVQPAPAYDYYAVGTSSNTAAGVAAGAAAGGLLGAAASDPRNRGAAAVGGAAAGALIGGLIGNSIDQQEAEAARAYRHGYDTSYGYAYSPYRY
jgi:uncharacterized protein YcfJ